MRGAAEAVPVRKTEFGGNKMKAFFRLMLSDMRKLFNIKTVLISAAAFILAVAVLARNGAGDSFVIYVTGGFLPEEQDNLQQLVAALAEYTGLTACIGYITQTDNAPRLILNPNFQYRQRLSLLRPLCS